MVSKQLGEQSIRATRAPLTQVVLAASICSRGGKAIISRQFRDLPKEKVAGLLAIFPKLIQGSKQHTTVEHDNVRYVYQPLEELYVVLITNRQSNILQDIETLRLLVQVVTSVVRVVDEREILLAAFDLLGAFDEVVSQGYRENLSLQQIQTFLEMESHEEKIQEIIERNKELEATEDRKRKAKQLEMQRKEAAKRGLPGNNAGGHGHGSFQAPAFQAPAPSFVQPAAAPAPIPETTHKPRAPRGKGMQLGKKKGSGFDDSPSASLLANADIAVPTPKPKQQQQQAAPAASAPSAYNPEVQGVHLTVAEVVTATLGRDGSVKSAEVKGDVQLRIGNPDHTKIRISLEANAPGVKYRTHPNVDKALFSSRQIIGLKDPSRGFPSNGAALGVLRYSANAPEEAVPLTFNCWFAKSDPGFYDVTLEYEVSEAFTGKMTNVSVIVPLVSSNAHISDSSITWDQFDDHLEWIIPEITADGDTSSGAFEFTAEADQEDEFFPMEVSFTLNEPETTVGNVKILNVFSATAEDENIPYQEVTRVTSDNYQIV